MTAHRPPTALRPMPPAAPRARRATAIADFPRTAALPAAPAAAPAAAPVSARLAVTGTTPAALPAVPTAGSAPAPVPAQAAGPWIIPPAQLDDRDRRLLNLLRGIYPLWRITCRIDRHGRRWWWALRILPLTPPHRPGLLTWFARPTLTQIAAELHHQDALIRLRGNQAGIGSAQPASTVSAPTRTKADTARPSIESQPVRGYVEVSFVSPRTPGTV